MKTYMDHFAPYQYLLKLIIGWQCTHIQLAICILKINEYELKR